MTNSPVATSLRAFMSAEGRTEATENGDVHFFASVLFNPRNLRGDLYEAIQEWFGSFDCLLGVHVTPRFLRNFDNRQKCERQCSVVELGRGQYAMLLRIQVGGAQSLVIIPMGANGFANYLASCERTLFTPVVAWCPENCAELLLHMPVGLGDVKRLVELAKESAENHDDSVLQKIATLASSLAHQGRETLIEGVELTEMVISCVVPED